jgi:predicted component of type VI protein secretion system
MASDNPIVQCAACGAKLRLKAASLKVLKQVRCGKCQAMIEIPDVLKNGGTIPDEPVLAKAAVTNDDASDASTPQQSPVATPKTPVKPSSTLRIPKPALAPAPVSVKPSPAPVPVTPPRSPVSVAPQTPAATPATPQVPTQTEKPEPADVPTPLPQQSKAAKPFAMEKETESGFPAIPVARDLETRMEMLTAKVDAQQETIALLTAQIRQIVKAQITAVETAKAILDR